MTVGRRLEKVAAFVYRRLLSGRVARYAVNSLLRKLVPPSVRIGPARLLLDRQDPVISGALWLGVYEQLELAFFRQHIATSRSFLDIGANVGLYTALAQKAMAATAQIVAVEPHLRSYGLLLQNMEGNRPPNGQPSAQVFALNVAAGSSSHMGTLYCSSTNGGDHRMAAPAEAGDLSTWTPCQTAVEPLDEALERLGISQVDFIKIDVQGYEHQALQGLARTLAQSPHVVLMSEFWPAGLSKAGGDGMHYLGMLEASGFEICTLKPSRTGWLTPVVDQQALVDALPGAHYTTLVALKGWHHQDFKAPTSPGVFKRLFFRRD